MRATVHSGRANTKGQTYKAKHNDRKFDYENVSHIDTEKTADNYYSNCAQIFLYQEFGLTKKEKEKLLKMDFTETEKFFYKKKFSAWLESQNQKHELSRHTERIRSMDEVYSNKKTCPDETILQFGNMKGSVDRDLLLACYQEFFKWHEAKFGEHIQILNFAIHDDEAVPHIHERKVFFCEDENGNPTINQGKALEHYYTLPEGTTKSRFNNLKQQYTAECREMWEAIGREHGLQLEEERLPKRKHQEKNEYILEQQEKQIASLEAEIGSLSLRKIELDTLCLEAEERLKKANESIGEAEGYYQELTADISDLLTARETCDHVLELARELEAQKEFVEPYIPDFPDYVKEKSEQSKKHHEAISKFFDKSKLKSHGGAVGKGVTKKRDDFGAK